MSQLAASGRHLLEIARDSLIPWANDADPFVLLGASPRIIGPNRVRNCQARNCPCCEAKDNKVRVQVWRDENLNSLTWAAWWKAKPISFRAPPQRCAGNSEFPASAGFLMHQPKPFSSPRPKCRCVQDKNLTGNKATRKSLFPYSVDAVFKLPESIAIFAFRARESTVHTPGYLFKARSFIHFYAQSLIHSTYREWSNEMWHEFGWELPKVD